MNTKEILEAELAKYNIKWCRHCDSRASHKRGFVYNSDKFTIHLDSEVVTRSTLHRALHEVGHCVNKEAGLRRYEQEALAEKFATDTMRAYGITVPRAVIARGVAYVTRKQRHGNNIINSR